MARMHCRAAAYRIAALARRNSSGQERGAAAAAAAAAAIGAVAVGAHYTLLAFEVDSGSSTLQHCIGTEWEGLGCAADMATDTPAARGGLEAAAAAAAGEAAEAAEAAETAKVIEVVV
jgi:hypothetical protein